MLAARSSESKAKLFIKTAATSAGRQVTSPSDVTSTSMSPVSEDITSELGVQLTVGRRLKHIAMKATFDQPRHKDSHVEERAGHSKSNAFYASELLGSFITDRQSQPTPQPATTLLQAVEVPLSTFIVVGSPFSHTVHYINAEQLHEDRSPSSTSQWSPELSSSSPGCYSSSSQVTVMQSETDITDEPSHFIDVSPADSSDDTAADLADLDKLREADLLPLPPCSSESSSWYLGLTDDELRRLLIGPECSEPVMSPTVAVDDLLSASEFSWPSPSADVLPPGQTIKADIQDYSTPEVIELLGSVFDDWLHDDPDVGSLFSTT